MTVLRRLTCRSVTVISCRPCAWALRLTLWHTSTSVLASLQRATAAPLCRSPAGIRRCRSVRPPTPPNTHRVIYRRVHPLCHSKSLELGPFCLVSLCQLHASLRQSLLAEVGGQPPFIRQGSSSSSGATPRTPKGRLLVRSPTYRAATLLSADSLLLRGARISPAFDRSDTDKPTPRHET